MSEVVLTNIKHYVGGVDLSGVYNRHALVMTADPVETTAFGDETREYLGGLIGVGSEHEGYWDYQVDSDLVANLAAAARNVTVAPSDTEGEIAYFFASIGTLFEQGAQVGEAYAFTASHQPTGTVTRGRILAIGTRTSSDTGTAFQLGAVAAGQSVRASLHVTAVAGTSPEVDVTVQSDAAADMLTPTTQITFPTYTAIGGEILSEAGAITDDWWAATWTLGADTTSTTFMIAVGIS